MGLEPRAAHLSSPLSQPWGPSVPCAMDYPGLPQAELMSSSAPSSSPLATFNNLFGAPQAQAQAAPSPSSMQGSYASPTHDAFASLVPSPSHPQMVPNSQFSGLAATGQQDGLQQHVSQQPQSQQPQELYFSQTPTLPPQQQQQPQQPQQPPQQQQQQQPQQQAQYQPQEQRRQQTSFSASATPERSEEAKSDSSGSALAELLSKVRHGAPSGLRAAVC